MQAKKPWLVQVDQWLWQNEANVSNKWMRMLWHFARIIFAVARDVINGHVTLHAMGLVYTTILSLVPFLALSFSVLKGFGVHDQLEPTLLTAMEPIGDKRFEIVEKIIGFVDKMNVKVLGFVGFLVLFYTVLSLVHKVEVSFNEIWRVVNARSLAQRFSNYISVILTGPALVFGALGATAALVGSDTAKQIYALEPLGWIFSSISKMMPYMLIIVLFTGLYTFIPNTKVRFKSAFIGGLVAGIIWQSTGYAFTKFVAGSTNYAAIYSGFAVGIIFLIWVYLAWLILLIGASVSFYAQHANQITRNRRNVPSPVIDEKTGLALMYQVASRYDSKGGGTAISEMESNLSVGPEVIQRVIDKLIRHGLLVRTGEDDDSLIPGRSLDKIPLTELFDAIRNPNHPLPGSLLANTKVNDLFGSLEAQTRAALGSQSVLEWIRNEQADTGDKTAV